MEASGNAQPKGRKSTREYAQAKIKGGWLNLGPYFKKCLVEFCEAHEGEKCWITVIVGTARSIAQNAFFHGPFIDACVRATGETDRDAWKGFFKEMFLRLPDGRGGFYTQSTSALTVKEFADFLTKCIQWCMDNLSEWRLETDEHKMYKSSLGSKDIDFYKDEKEQMKMFDKNTGEVLTPEVKTPTKEEMGW